MLGIAIATYNRADSLSRLLKRIKTTEKPNTSVVVCNDGSSDATEAVCRENNVNLIGKNNKGISWNKNRGLFFLMNETSAQRILLIEDDVIISEESWLDDWIQAIDQWGHLTWANDELVRARSDRYISGNGSPADPYILKYVTGQVMAFSREALEAVGYFDTRFHGYGYEHIDLSRRLHRAGHGMTDAFNSSSGQTESGYVNITGGVEISDLPTVSDRSTTDENRKVYESIRKESTYRPAWRNDQEKDELLKEITDMNRMSK